MKHRNGLDSEDFDNSVKPCSAIVPETKKPTRVKWAQTMLYMVAQDGIEPPVSVNR